MVESVVLMGKSSYWKLTNKVQLRIVEISANLRCAAEAT